MMPKKVIITPEVREVLAAATVTGTEQAPVVKLNTPKLDRDIYLATDKVLKALGGRWSKRAGGHVFDRPVEGELAEALRSGTAVDQARTAEQFFTPPSVAARVFELARLDSSHHVLEPSAGRGALLVEPLRLGCLITAIEQDDRLAPILADMIGHHGGGVWAGDFMVWEPVARAPIDRALMNPPFGRGKDMDHVERALRFVRPGGILVSVMSPHWTFAADQRSMRFRGLVNDHSHTWNPLPDGSFKSSGTNVSTGILTIIKGSN